MNKEYKYRLSYGTWYWTVVHIVVFIVTGIVLTLIFEGGYVLAWFLSLMLAIIGLMTLSIPRKIAITEDGIEICCISDYTEIPYEDIASVRTVPAKEMKLFLPIFASSGFFGYYGHFLDLRRLDRVKIYASEWRNFVEITDIYEERLYVSCTEADKLVAQLTPPGGNRPEEEDDDPNDESDPDAEGTGADETAPAREPGLQEN